MATGENFPGETTAAFLAGRRIGFGISALVLSLVGFLSLLGAEKAILAIVLGALAVRGSGQASTARRLGVVAISLGTVFLLTMAVVLVVFRGELLELVQMLQKLS